MLFMPRTPTTWVLPGRHGPFLAFSWCFFSSRWPSSAPASAARCVPYSGVFRQRQQFPLFGFIAGCARYVRVRHDINGYRYSTTWPAASRQKNVLTAEFSERYDPDPSRVSYNSRPACAGHCELRFSRKLHVFSRRRVLEDVSTRRYCPAKRNQSSSG